MLKKERAAFILERLNELYPETPVPLDHRNNFELLVAVLLSAQCTDIRVNQVTPALFAEADNPFDMQHVPLDTIYKIVRPCGLAPQKSSAISTHQVAFSFSSPPSDQRSCRRYHRTGWKHLTLSRSTVPRQPE